MVVKVLALVWDEVSRGGIVAEVTRNTEVLSRQDDIAGVRRPFAEEAARFLYQPGAWWFGNHVACGLLLDQDKTVIGSYYRLLEAERFKFVYPFDDLADQFWNYLKHMVWAFVSDGV